MTEPDLMAESSETRIDGGCTCRAVRYGLIARPMFVHCCHCTWCQRETGSAFALNAMIEASKVTLRAGEVTRATLPSASGQGQVVSRCSRCGITLWSNYPGLRDKVHFVRVGTLDDPSLAPPDIHIYTSTKQPWVVLPATVLAVAEYYRRADYWPAESIERYNAVRAS